MREEATGEVIVQMGRGQLRSMAEAATFLINFLGQVEVSDSRSLGSGTPVRPPPGYDFRPSPWEPLFATTPSGTHQSRSDTRSLGRGRVQQGSSKSQDHVGGRNHELK